MGKRYTVYMHVFPNEKKYIGITSGNVEQRWSNGFGYSSQYVFYAIVKYGWDNIKHYILFYNLTKKEAEEKERELIREYDTTIHGNGYNVDNGGSNKGKHSEETKKKISESKKGRELDEATKKKLRIAMTDERKEKMIKASVEKCSKPVICIETNTIYKSISEAHRETGADMSAISNCCKKKKRYKTAGGYHWEYVSQERG